MLKKILIGVVGLFVLVGVIGSFSSDEPEDEPRQAAATTVATDAPPPATTKPKPKPKPKVDSGRMSDTEYASFQRAHQELLDESIEFSDGLQACSVIGQTGDLAGFRTCIQDAYSGLDEDIDFAIFTADDTLDDVARQCLAALRSYGKITRDYRAVVANTYDVSNRLDFDAFAAAFGELVPSTQRYQRFSTNALAACQPR